MNRVRFNFHGVAVEARGDDAELLDRLGRDFRYFETGGPGGPADVSWTLRLGAPPSDDRPSGLATFRAPAYKVFDRGPVRRISYPEAAWAVYDYRFRVGRLYAEDRDLLHELAYLAILSRCGEELDRRGLHRVHALGFESGGRGGLLILPSGGGKSVLALELLRRTRVNVLSDDSPLISRDLSLREFPLRWGFKPDADLSGVPEGAIRPFLRRRHGPKRLVDSPFFSGRVGRAVPLEWVLIGRRRAGRPEIAPLSGAAALPALAEALVLGRGLAQLSEYCLSARPGRVSLLAAIAGSRAAAALGAVRRARTFRFFLGNEPAANAQALESLVTA